MHAASNRSGVSRMNAEINDGDALFQGNRGVDAKVSGSPARAASARRNKGGPALCLSVCCVLQTRS